MPGIGERLWEMGKSPPQHISLLVFGLAAIVVAFLAASMIPLVGASAALVVSGAALLAVGGFFLTLALFLGAFATSGDSVTATVWRVAQLLAAVLVLIFVFM